MTKQIDIIDDPKYIPVLDHGFVGLIDSMGDDSAIVKSARISYGKGTKSLNEDRGLIRYLVRHFHTSPIEMCEVKFHVKLPIFIMRQLVRTRTANLNEYSGRYSVMSDEFYVPDFDHIQPQSTVNKQGRAGTVSDTSKKGVQWLMNAAYEMVYNTYQTLLGPNDGCSKEEAVYDAYEDDDPLLDDDFDGIARESARTVLSVGNYTEAYWKIDLSNLFKFLRLRSDSHAQYEIRVFADAMYDLIKPIFPLACEAYEDYIKNGMSLSRMDKNLLKTLLGSNASEVLKASIEEAGSKKKFAENLGMSVREFNEFVANFELKIT